MDKVSDERLSELYNRAAGAALGRKQVIHVDPVTVANLTVDLLDARDHIARAAVWLQENPQTFAEGLTKVIAARAILTGEID